MSRVGIFVHFPKYATYGQKSIETGQSSLEHYEPVDQINNVCLMPPEYSQPEIVDLLWWVWGVQKQIHFEFETRPKRSDVDIRDQWKMSVQGKKRYLMARNSEFWVGIWNHEGYSIHTCNQCIQMAMWDSPSMDKKAKGIRIHYSNVRQMDKLMSKTVSTPACALSSRAVTDNGEHATETRAVHQEMPMNLEQTSFILQSL